MPNSDSAAVPATDSELRKLQEYYEGAHPREVLRWAFDNVDRVAITISLQASGVTLVHMAREITSDPVPVLFLNTGFHFPDTLDFRDKLVNDWGLRLIESSPEPNQPPDAWRTTDENPNLIDPVEVEKCCEINKRSPLRELKKDLDGYVTAIRRHQTKERAATPVISLERQRDGRSIYKVCPMVSWTSSDVWRYVEAHDLPVHPLYEQGYLSIGCAPCTRPVAAGDDERAGRWAGMEKTECGIQLADEQHPADTSPPIDQ